jgi:hypothetical protein
MLQSRQKRILSKPELVLSLPKGEVKAVSKGVLLQT